MPLSCSEMSVEVDQLKAAACEAIDQAAGQLHTLSQQIWSSPELAYQEHQAHKLLTDFLRERDFKVSIYQ